MKIGADYFLEGVRKVLFPGGALMNVRRFLVIHATSGWGLESTFDWWRDPKAGGANAHLVIGRDGTIVQCRPFNRVANHAGKSKWRDPKTLIQYSQINTCSIGIELCNFQETPQGKKYPRGLEGGLTGKDVEIVSGKYPHSSKVTFWEKYPSAQIEACFMAAEAIVKRFNLDDVIGHSDCSPDRKVDPGPAFNMLAFRESLGFNGMPKP